MMQYWITGDGAFCFLMTRQQCVQMGTILEHNFLNIHLKIQQLQN